MMNTRWTGLATVSSVFLRLALGISFLSAVADRFGLWGVYGQRNVAWGNYARFVAYTAKLNWFLPGKTIPALAIIATAAEVLFGLLLVLGWKTRTIALLSGVLLTIFALTKTMALRRCALPVCVDLLRGAFSQGGLFCFDERQVNQMLAQEPDLKLVGA